MLQHRAKTAVPPFARRQCPRHDGSLFTPGPFYERVTLDTATALLSDLSFAFHEDLDFGEVSCWNRVGIQGLNLDIPLDGVNVTLQPDHLTVAVDLGEIRGERWEIYARDGQDDDGCETIEADLAWITFTDGLIEADLDLRAKDGRLDVELVNTPRLYGTLDMDIEWQPEWAESLGFDWDLWPDDWFMGLINDYLLDIVVEMAAEAAPELLAEGLPDPSFETEVGDFAMGGELVSLSHDASALRATADVDVSWTGQPQCDTLSSGDPGGRDPNVMLGDEDLAVGTTEAFVNRLGWRAWSQGLMCLDAHGVDGFVRELLPDAADTLSDFDVSVQLREPPVVAFDGGALGATLHGLRLDLAGTHQREEVHLLDVELDLDAQLAARVDQDLAAIVLDLEDIALGLDVRESSHLLSQEDGAEEELEAFLERFTPAIALAKVQDLAVAPAVFEIAELLVIRLTGLELSGGAFSAGVELYDAEDPAVDGVAPDTSAEILDGTDSSILVAFDGADDREGALAWKYRVDDDGWSAWTLEEELEIMVAEAGDHTLEVVARDAWWNEDETPWSVSFDRDELAGEGPMAFGCSAAPASTWLLALAGALGVRRRRT